MTPFKVGLTGGIASGKSTVSRYFTKIGVSVYDTDDISRQLMAPGYIAYQAIHEHFGDRVIQADRTLDRLQLREIVFNDPAQRKWLETLLHPLILNESLHQLGQPSSQPYSVLVVPLMFESGFDKKLDHIIAIDCPAETQLQRLTQRDQISLELAQKMIGAQLSNTQRLNQADSILKNFNDHELQPQIESLHSKLVELASSTR